jgi:hypothetical protein
VNNSVLHVIARAGRVCKCTSAHMQGKQKFLIHFQNPNFCSLPRQHHQHITTTDPTTAMPFQFFQLPRELRDDVVSYLFTDIKKTCSVSSRSTAPPSLVATIRVPQPHVRLVSRQMRTEYDRRTVIGILTLPEVLPIKCPPCGRNSQIIEASVEVWAGEMFCNWSFNTDAMNLGAICVKLDQVRSIRLTVHLPACQDVSGEVVDAIEHSTILANVRHAECMVITTKGGKNVLAEWSAGGDWIVHTELIAKLEAVPAIPKSLSGWAQLAETTQLAESAQKDEMEADTVQQPMWRSRKLPRRRRRSRGKSKLGKRVARSRRSRPSTTRQTECVWETLYVSRHRQRCVLY